MKSKALIEQYDGFEPRALPGEHVNGALTVGENIGDLGGLTIGHKAYLISQGGAASAESRQQLFMNWAYCWRTKRRKEQEQQYLTIDPHSPPEFRANIVRNLDEFHEVFEHRRGRRALARPGRPGPHLVIDFEWGPTGAASLVARRLGRGGRRRAVVHHHADGRAWTPA